MQPRPWGLTLDRAADCHLGWPISSTFRGKSPNSQRSRVTGSIGIEGSRRKQTHLHPVALALRPRARDGERDLAEKTGAEWAAWGTVQKVSNLILNINLYIEDVQTGRIELAHSVDIRGNTDESWLRGLNYMIRNYVLEQP
jgi:hypothetical protein